jgi:acyl carrier protein
MEPSEILQRLKGYISKEILDGKDIGLEASTPLLEWGIINSLEMARFVAFLENRFSVDVPAEKIVVEHFRDLKSIVALVVELSSEKNNNNLLVKDLS